MVWVCYQFGHNCFDLVIYINVQLKDEIKMPKWGYYFHVLQNKSNTYSFLCMFSALLSYWFKTIHTMWFILLTKLNNKHNYLLVSVLALNVRAKGDMVVMRVMKKAVRLGIHLCRYKSRVPALQINVHFPTKCPHHSPSVVTTY